MPRGWQLQQITDASLKPPASSLTGMLYTNAASLQDFSLDRNHREVLETQGQTVSSCQESELRCSQARAQELSSLVSGLIPSRGTSSIQEGYVGRGGHGWQWQPGKPPLWA